MIWYIVSCFIGMVIGICIIAIVSAGKVNEEYARGVQYGKYLAKKEMLESGQVNMKE